VFAKNLPACRGYSPQTRIADFEFDKRRQFFVPAHNKTPFRRPDVGQQLRNSFSPVEQKAYNATAQCRCGEMVDATDLKCAALIGSENRVASQLPN
jgi:hypothetical protein